MKKFILISIFIVGFILFVLLMEMLNVDHILNKLLSSYKNEEMKSTNKMLLSNSINNLNFIEKSINISK